MTTKRHYYLTTLAFSLALVDCGDLGIITPNSSNSFSVSADASTIDSGPPSGSVNTAFEEDLFASDKLVTRFSMLLNHPSHGGVALFRINECKTQIAYIEELSSDQIVTSCAITILDEYQKSNAEWHFPENISYLGGEYQGSRQVISDGITLIPGREYIALFGNRADAIGFGMGKNGVFDLAAVGAVGNGHSDVTIRLQALFTALGR